MNTFLLHCSFVLKVFFMYANSLSVVFPSQTSSFSTRVSFSFLSALQSPSVKSNLNSLFYFPHILIDAWFVLSCNWDIFRCSKNRTIVYADEKLTRRLSALVRVVVYQWNPQIHSLTYVNRRVYVVGRTWGWLFVYKTLYFENKENSMGVICRIIISSTIVSIIFVWDIWGSFELNSQMTPSLFQPFLSYLPYNIELLPRS